MRNRNDQAISKKYKYLSNRREMKEEKKLKARTYLLPTCSFAMISPRVTSAASSTDSLN